MKFNIAWIFNKTVSRSHLDDLKNSYIIEERDLRSVNWSDIEESLFLLFIDKDISFSEIRHSLNLVKNKRPIQVAYFLSNENSEPLIEIINSKLVDFICPANSNPEKIKKIVKSAKDKYSFEVEQKEILQRVKSQNIELEKLRGGLEKVVYERTLDQENKKRDLEQKVKKVRALNRFMRDLAGAHEVEELVDLLRKEIKRYHRVKNPILVYFQENIGYRVVYYIKNNVFQKNLVDTDLVHHKLGGHPVEDRQILANTFGRPFGKIVSVPLISLNSKKMDSYSSVLFFEHSLEDAEIPEFVDMVSERLQSLSVSLQRIILDQELRLTSFMWENTFNGINDPIAIVAQDYSILRSNREFKKDMEPNANNQRCYEVFALEESPCDGCPLNESVALSTSQLRVKGRFFEVQSYPLESSKSLEYINHYLDVTNEKKLYGKILQNEKMVAIGQLAGNIAHELNNPLTGIKSAAQYLKSEAELGSTYFNDLNEIERATVRCHNIINNLLEFSKEKPTHMEVVDMNEVVEKTLPLLKSKTSQYRRDVVLAQAPIFVKCDRQLFQQVLFNLIDNACQAMGDEGSLRIETGVEEGEACFRVIDSGPGISEELQKKIFDPFFTTKKKGEGTGLGLSLSKTIVEGFHGRIILESELGRGAEFSVFLPLALEEQ